MRACTKKIPCQSIAKLTHPKPHFHVRTPVDATIIKTGFKPQTCRFNFLIRTCLQRGELRRARKLFDRMPHRNTFSANMMIMGYIQSGDLATASNLLDGIHDRNVVSWTMLIGGYAHNNKFREAFGLFAEMLRHGVEPDYVTFSTLLSGFIEFDSVNEVTQVHACVVKLGHDSAMIVCNSLLDSYCKTRSLGLACQLFDHMPKKDSVTYNALMAGYSKKGLNREALNLFFRMQDMEFKPTEFTFATVLCCGIQLDNIEFGQQVHSLLVKTNFVWNVFVANALLDFYTKHDHVAEAQKLFNEMPELDGISYNVSWMASLTMYLSHVMSGTEDSKNLLNYSGSYNSLDLTESNSLMLRC